MTLGGIHAPTHVPANVERIIYIYLYLSMTTVVAQGHKRVSVNTTEFDSQPSSISLRGNDILNIFISLELMLRKSGLQNSMEREVKLQLTRKHYIYVQSGSTSFSILDVVLFIVDTKSEKEMTSSYHL